MDQLTGEVDVLTREEFGLAILDVRVKKIELPANVSDAVYARMRAEREREARDYRSKGKEQFIRITSEADRKVRVIEANAFETAEKIRGDGDQEAARIYADAYQSNRDFYAFYRSLTAYKNSFSNKSDILLIEPNGEFFQHLAIQDQ
jgi:membrane protease subunit HflC